MMKKNICLSLLVLMLSACATENRHQQNTTSNTSETPQLGAPNPASQFCVEQGGQLQIKNEAQGQVGYCYLKDGRILEEWSFFKTYNTCMTEKVSSLIGQKDISDDDIRKLTHAGQIRRLAPGQPMTMDFREDRVNVTIDPSSKKIIHATCG